MKQKGRKIYKTKEKNYYGKNPINKIFSAGLTVLLIGGIGFIGYSVAEPLVDFTRKAGDDETAIETSTAAVFLETAETETYAEATEDVITTDSLVASVTSNSENKDVETTTEESIVTSNIEVYRAAAISEYDMYSIDAIKAAIERIPQNQGIEYVEVPLKASGGKIYYATAAQEAAVSGAVQSDMTLMQIVSAVKSAGYKPAASISIFNDYTVPAMYPAYGYIIVGDGSAWLDNSPSKGGKAWVNPYSEQAVSYNAFIAGEIADAGFEKVICSDVTFPPFRDSDLAMLDSKLSAADRYMALTSAANMLYDRILSNGSSMLLEVSAVSLLQGNDDILQPMLLNVNTVILNMNLDEMGQGVNADNTLYEFSGTVTENVNKMLGLVGNKLSDFNVVIRLSGSASKSDLIKAAESMTAGGFASFVLG